MAFHVHAVTQRPGSAAQGFFGSSVKTLDEALQKRKINRFHDEKKKMQRKVERNVAKKHQPLRLDTTFGQRFAALPADIKLAIIREVVREVDVTKGAKEIKIINTELAQHHATKVFLRDSELLREAKTQYLRVNTFTFRLPGYLSSTFDKVGHELRTLTIVFKISIEGGNVDSGSIGTLKKRDTDRMSTVLSKFTRLESLTFRVRNTGSISWGRYYEIGGGMINARKCPRLVQKERLGKMGVIIDMMRAYKVEQWKNRCPRVRKVVMFTQVEQEKYSWYEVVNRLDPKRYCHCSGDPCGQTYEDRMGFLLQLPQALVYFDECEEPGKDTSHWTGYHLVEGAD